MASAGEGRNEVLHNLLRIDSPPEDFEWVIKTQDGVDGYTKAFEKLLGKAKDGDPLGDIDPALRQVLEHMKVKDPARFNLALVRLKELRDKLDNQELVILGNVDRAQ